MYPIDKKIIALSRFKVKSNLFFFTAGFRANNLIKAVPSKPADRLIQKSEMTIKSGYMYTIEEHHTN